MVPLSEGDHRDGLCNLINPDETMPAHILFEIQLSSSYFK